MGESSLQLDAASTRMVSLYSYTDEFERFYEPLYLEARNRGFHDLRGTSLTRALTLIERNLPANIQTWDISDDGVWSFRFASVWLRLDSSPDNPGFLNPEAIGLSSVLSAVTINKLRHELQDYIQQSMNSVETFTDVVILIMQLVDLTSYFCSVNINQTFSLGPIKWSNNDIKIAEMMKWNRAGLNPLTVSDTCHEYLGMTPLEICKMIPRQYRILEMKSVRSDYLTEKFVTFGEKFIHKCRKETTDSLRSKLHPNHDFQRRNLATLTRDEIIQEMVRPHVTFHGTAQYSVASISKHGFKKPGEEVGGMKIASPRSGAIFRRGIYSSQAAWYAMSFAECHSDQPVPLNELPGIRLFVCATITGRTFHARKFGKSWEDYWKEQRKVHGPRVKGFDSHFDGGHEYVVHDTYAMLPCYVISLDWGVEALNAVRKLQNSYGTYYGAPNSRAAAGCNLVEVLSPQEMREKEQEDKARASKILFLGYGAAQGPSFRITSIVETDDDEELQTAEAYHRLKEQAEYESEQPFDFWVEVLAGRGPRFTHELIKQVPMNLEKLLYLEDDVVLGE